MRQFQGAKKEQAQAAAVISKGVSRANFYESDRFFCGSNSCSGDIWIASAHLLIQVKAALDSCCCISTAISTYSRIIQYHHHSVAATTRHRSVFVLPLIHSHDHTRARTTMRLPAPITQLPPLPLVFLAMLFAAQIPSASAMMPANAIAISYVCRQHCQVNYQYCAASAGKHPCPLSLRYRGEEGRGDGKLM